MISNSTRNIFHSGETKASQFHHLHRDEEAEENLIVLGIPKYGAARDTVQAF